MEGKKQETVYATDIAFSEVSDILKHLDNDLFKKIPESFVDLIEKNKKQGYKVNIDYSKDINEQITKESKVILGLIYRDFTCDDLEREKLLKQEDEDIKKEEKRLQEKYNVDKIFENKKAKEEIHEDKMIVVKKENKIKEIFNKVKSLIKFGKKRI